MIKNERCLEIRIDLCREAECDAPSRELLMLVQPCHLSQVESDVPRHASHTLGAFSLVRLAADREPVSEASLTAGFLAS